MKKRCFQPSSLTNKIIKKLIILPPKCKGKTRILKISKNNINRTHCIKANYDSREDFYIKVCFTGTENWQQSWTWMLFLSVCLEVNRENRSRERNKWPWMGLFFLNFKNCWFRCQQLSCVWLWDPVDSSTPGFPVLHYLPVCSDSHPLSWWCCLTIPSSSAPFLFCLQLLPASGSFLV